MKKVLLSGTEAGAAERYFAATGRSTLLLPHPSAEMLREYDQKGERYFLVHVGEEEDEVGGGFERAHYRIKPSEVPALAEKLRPRERVLVKLFAFGYKYMEPPPNANLMLDLRALPNPFWEPELSALDGRDEPVRNFVLKDPRAEKMLQALEDLLKSVLPLVAQEERWDFMVALGCTGGRHRSVGIAWELAQRLKRWEMVEVLLIAPQLGINQ